MENLFHVIGTTMGGAKETVQYATEDYGNVLKFSIPMRYLNGKRYNTVVIETDLLTSKAGDPGYFFYPTNFGNGIQRTFFNEKPNAELITWLSAMPICGLCEQEKSCFVRVEGQSGDARFEVRVQDNVYSIKPRFDLQGEDPEEDISIFFYRMPFATYVDMSKVYRKYQMDIKGCRPLRERAAMREPLRKAAEALEVRIRMGWKPIPTPVRHQTEENEPPLHVTCTVEMLNKLVDKMQAAGIDKAEICLVGWAVGGHDGRFPQQYPSDPRYGGDEELCKFIAKAQRMGYQVVAHTVSCGAYEIANNFDIADLAKRRNEKGEYYPFVRDIYKANGLNGGEPYAVCPKRAYERYAKEDLPVVRGYGFEGLEYIDELTAYVPEKCDDPNHPVSRKQAQGYYRKIVELATKLFGGYQSEGFMDYMIDAMDAILYVGMRAKDESQWVNPLFDEGIPFWQLVYHGIVLSNPTSSTVNYPIKDAKQNLIFIEYGGRPLLYINSKFGPGRDWMGTVDLYSLTDEDLDESVKALKVAYDEYEPLRYLQYEFMENHEKLSDTVYRTTYSDGTVALVNYALPGYKITKPDGTVIEKVFEKDAKNSSAAEQKQWMGKNTGIFWAN